MVDKIAYLDEEVTRVMVAWMTVDPVGPADAQLWDWSQLVQVSGQGLAEVQIQSCNFLPPPKLFQLHMHGMRKRAMGFAEQTTSSQYGKLFLEFDFQSWGMPVSNTPSWGCSLRHRLKNTKSDYSRQIHRRLALSPCTVTEECNWSYATSHKIRIGSFHRKRAASADALIYPNTDAGSVSSKSSDNLL